ncbi:hypothetical protein CHLRE_07g314600v5 [Chlamydomonas reinhardtii]|uniref:ribose-5-phosphate isomerase n=1 Tax=Chlamydomonas reinhardtii TaxID=3055 RepID=A8I668_CHLRE|nr:uncharacterized protein CHLRE_07g314600v5 [Chlamydomonas reinhardtii]PNW80367.1 hypothetical protein CHLRE_07g314600v5 [Chlamydomonas reinhardtii]|eukprot:XP_001700790.1 ribose-5 phosphate isomerase-related protein [Chlamydomonas reinhardtii]
MLACRMQIRSRAGAVQRAWPCRLGVQRAVRCSAAQQVDAAKLAAVRECVDRFVTSNSVVALGSGEMVNLAIEELGRRLAIGSLQNVVGVPACDVAAHEAAFHGVPLLPEAREAEATVALAEADMVDVAARAALLGCAADAPQQPDVPRLLRVLKKAGSGARLVLLTSADRVVKRLGGSLPVWIGAEGWEEWAEELDDVFLGDAELWRRSASGQPENPRGGDMPYVSPDGNTIVDVRFYEGLKLFGEDDEYGKIADEISAISGVVGHGLVVGRAAAVVMARPGQQQPDVVEF